MLGAQLDGAGIQFSLLKKERIRQNSTYDDRVMLMWLVRPELFNHCLQGCERNSALLFTERFPCQRQREDGVFDEEASSSYEIIRTM